MPFAARQRLTQRGIYFLTFLDFLNRIEVNQRADNPAHVSIQCVCGRFDYRPRNDFPLHRSAPKIDKPAVNERRQSACWRLRSAVLSSP